MLGDSVWIWMNSHGCFCTCHKTQIWSWCTFDGYDRLLIGILTHQDDVDPYWINIECSLIKSAHYLQSPTVLYAYNQLLIKSGVELEVNSITTNIKVGHLRTYKYQELDYMVCVACRLHCDLWSGHIQSEVLNTKQKRDSWAAKECLERLGPNPTPWGSLGFWPKTQHSCYAM